MNQIVGTKSFCKGCGGKLKVEKCNDEKYRWDILFCENWCFTKETPKKEIKRSEGKIVHRHIDGKHFMSEDGENFYEVELKITPSYMKVVRKIDRLL